MNKLIPLNVLGKLTAAMEETMRVYAVVRLYKAEEGQKFEYTKVWGALFLATTAKDETPIFKIVDMNTYQCLWEHEVFPGMEFQKLNSHWLGFEGEEVFWAFSFAEQQEVEQFRKTVVNIVPAEVEKKKSIFGRFFGKKKKSSPKTPSPNTQTRQAPNKRPVIGRVSNFQRSMHIGFDAESGFKYENLPDEWKSLFAEVGVTKDDLQDAKTAKKMFKAMKKFERGDKPKPKRPSRKKPPVGPNDLSSDPLPPPSGGLTPPSGGLAPPSGGLAPPSGGLAPPSGGLAPPPGGLAPPPGGSKPSPPGGSKPAPPKKPTPGGKSGPPAPPGRGDLLAQIREGRSLRKVDPKKERKVNIDIANMSADKKQDLMSVLKASIKTRHGKMHADDSESDGNSSDSFSSDDDF